MALGETGDWDGATKRIINMINKGPTSDPKEGGLPEGYGSGRLLEDFARELEAEHGMELGMAFPTVLAAYSAAMQGGFLTPMLTKIKPAPTYKWVPTVVQFMGVAEAGQQKSTLLGEVAPLLKKALDRDGADDRRSLANQWRHDEMKKAEQVGVNVDGNPGDWDKVFQGGYCMSSSTSTGTPEGIRDWLVNNGGHRVILTAEPDILREVSAYAGKSGSGTLNNFLGGWDQEDIATDRAGNKDLFVREPSMPCVIMLQPGSFSQHTASTGRTDDFVDRGVFSRMLMWTAERVPVQTDFGSLEDWELDDAWDPEKPLASKLAVLAEKLADRMTSVVLRSNPYRVSKGVERAYNLAKLAWDMPRPTLLQEHRVMLGLEGTAGHKAAWNVQKMRAMISAAIRAADEERPGIGAVLDPFAMRFTSHVMRIAAVLTLADDPGATAVDTGHVEDVATRIMPWLWWGWHRIMADRMEESGRASMSEGLLKNAKEKDLSGATLLLAVMAKMQNSSGPGAIDGFTPSQILKKAEARIPHAHRGGVVRAQMRHTLEVEMVTDGLVEKVSEVQSATGQASGRYRLTVMGMDEAKINSNSA